MAGKKRVRGTQTTENAVGRFDIDELDEQGAVVEDAADDVETPTISEGIIVTYKEPVTTFRSGHETLRSGGVKRRVFSKETNGKEWRTVADSFIATCKLGNIKPDEEGYDSSYKAKYISHEEV